MLILECSVQMNVEVCAESALFYLPDLESELPRERSLLQMRGSVRVFAEGAQKIEFTARAEAVLVDLEREVLARVRNALLGLDVRLLSLCFGPLSGFTLASLGLLPLLGRPSFLEQLLVPLSK